MLPTLTLLAMLHLAPAADPITGTWQIKGDVAGNPLDVVCTIKQEGEKLSGSCTGVEAGKTNEVTGEVKNGTFTFKHGGDYQGTPLTIVYSGTAASPKELKGTISVEPFSVTGEFTATPAPAKP